MTFEHLRRSLMLASLVTVAATASMTALTGLPAMAQTPAWPTKPVRIIVPLAAGSAPDVVARLLADRLGSLWGQSVYVENKPGAGGIPGMSALARLSGDGYTLGFVPAAMATITPVVFKNPQFNIDTELQPIATVGTSPMMLVAPANAPFANVAELERYAKANPGKVNFAAAQLNSLPHLAGEMLSKTGGMGLFTVPYAGPPAAITAVISGDAMLTADGLPGVLQHVKGGRLKAVAVTSDKRLPGFDNVPTVAETYPGYLAMGWFQIFVPTGFPATQTERVSHDLNQVLRMPEVVAQLNDLGIYPQQSTPASAREFFASQRLLMRKIVADLGITPQ